MRTVSKIFYENKRRLSFLLPLRGARTLDLGLELGVGDLEKTVFSRLENIRIKRETLFGSFRNKAFCFELEVGSRWNIYSTGIPGDYEDEIPG